MSVINVRLQSASQPDVLVAMVEVRTARCVCELCCQLEQHWDVRSCMIVLIEAPQAQRCCLTAKCWWRT